MYAACYHARPMVRPLRARGRRSARVLLSVSRRQTRAVNRHQLGDAVDGRLRAEQPRGPPSITSERRRAPLCTAGALAEEAPSQRAVGGVGWSLGPSSDQRPERARTPATSDQPGSGGYNCTIVDLVRVHRKYRVRRSYLGGISDQGRALGAGAATRDQG